MIYTLTVQEDANGEPFIVLPDPILEKLDWKEGDTIHWTPKENGSYELRKQDDECN